MIKSLYKYFFAAFIFLFINFCFAQSPAELLNQYLDSYQNYQADFEQKVYDENNNIVQQVTGKIYLSRPEKFRWETTSPTKQIIVANDQILWQYDVDLAQVTQQKLSMRSADNPAILLSGRSAELLSHFQITARNDASNNMVFQLTPRFPRAAFRLMQMTFSQGTLNQIIVVNTLGQTSVFSFYNIQLNLEPDPSLFKLDIPPGVTVVNQ